MTWLHDNQESVYHFVVVGVIMLLIILAFFRSGRSGKGGPS